MSQEGREEVVAYVTNSNIDTEQGITVDTGYSLQYPPPAVDLAKLAEDKDGNWFYDPYRPFAKFRKASNRVMFHFPRRGQPLKTLADEWLCFRDGSNFTNTSLGFVVDMFPQLIEEHLDPKDGPYWYPTLLLNMDIKKALPKEGAKWLTVRVQLKKVKNGRMDLDVHVHDESGELVALSHHVGFILSATRNTSARRKAEPKL